MPPTYVPNISLLVMPIRTLHKAYKYLKPNLLLMLSITHKFRSFAETNSSRQKSWRLGFNTAVWWSNQVSTSRDSYPTNDEEVRSTGVNKLPEVCAVMQL